MIIVYVPKRFEAKISAIKESHDLPTLSIVERRHKLHAQEQRDTLRGVGIDSSKQALVASLKKS